MIEGRELFFIFRDATSNQFTYGAARFLYTAPARNGTVILDFNKAINPPCAFTAFATCPLPPPQNRLTLAVTAGVVFALKALIGRGRPVTVYVGLRQALLDSPTDCSLPSGHAAGSFAFAFFVTQVLLARRPRPPYAMVASSGLIVLAAAVGVSRVALGFHFPLDVVAGALIGAGLGKAGGRLFNRGVRV